MLDLPRLRESQQDLLQAGPLSPFVAESRCRIYLLSSSTTDMDGSGSAVSDTRGLQASFFILVHGGGTASLAGRGQELSWVSCGAVPPPASPALHWSLHRLRLCCVGQAVHPARLGRSLQAGLGWIGSCAAIPRGCQGCAVGGELWDSAE